MEAKPILIFDGTQRVISVSPSCAALLGIDRRQLVGLPCRDALGCPTCMGEICPLQQALSGESVEGLLPVSTAGKSLAVSSCPMVGDDDDIHALLHLRTEESGELTMSAGLQLVLDSLRELLRSDLAALAFYDPGMKEVRWQLTSGGTSALTTDIRLRPGQGFAGRIVMTGLPLRTFCFPRDLTEDPDSYPIFLAEGLRSALGVPLKGADKVLGVLMVASREELDYTSEDLERLTKVADSVTLAAEMMQMHEQAIRHERARLANEVHDGLSQNLFGLQLLIFDLQQHLTADQPEALEQGLRHTYGVLDSTLSEVRRLIADLRGSTRVQVGLISALSDHLGSFYRLTHLPVELVVAVPPGEEIDCTDVHEVLRIVQESLMNVYRHAGAGRIRVEVAREESAYRLVIEDDGKGFDPSAPWPEGHYGLTIMQERAARLHCELQIASEPGHGTAVTLRIPV